ncbi:type II secretion system protein [Candidatus Shapirobacteria bacterium]|nr:type II secretion system protein [Candidatus Shapirobacteria bacterium]
MKRRNFNRGQSIIEVVVALASVILVILALVKVTTISIKNASFARDQRLATQYAQKAIENARRLKEEEPLVFWSKSGEEDISGLEERFTGKINYNEVENDKKMEVKVLVFWTDEKGQHESKLTTFFTK